jgi:hypothetical protein
MRRHVQRMRSGGSDLRISAGGRQAELRQLWLVIAVDQVMHNSGMIGLGGEQLLQDRASFLAVGKRGVVIGLGREQRERIKSSRLVVVRILPVHLLHCRGVSPGSRFVVRFLAVGVERLQGQDVIALAVSRPGLHLAGLLQLRRGPLDGWRIRLIPELMPQAHGLAPVRHGALRVLLFDVEKSLLRLFVPERMQQRDTLFECLLRLRSTRHGKMHRAQLFLREFLVMMAFISRRGAGERRGNTQKPDQFAHGAPQSESSGRVEAGSRRRRDSALREQLSTPLPSVEFRALVCHGRKRSASSLVHLCKR